MSKPFLLSLWILGGASAVALHASAGEGPRKATSSPVVVKASVVPATTSKLAYVFLDDVRFLGGDAGGEDFGRVFGRLVGSAVRSVQGVVLRTHADVPTARAVLSRYGDLSKQDRVRLIAIRHETGFDGVVSADYRVEAGVLRLVIRYVDCNRGQVFAVRRFQGPLAARLFSAIEHDATELALSLRRSYRVTLDVDSNPQGAEVVIGGRRACRTPCTRELDEGDFDVEVRKAGHRPWRRRAFYKAGDRARLFATLYNPVADRYLNRAPAWRVDAQALSLGYRYAYFDLARPALRELHLFTLDYLVRLADLQIGPSFRASGAADVVSSFDTFVPSVSAQRKESVRVVAPAITAQYALLEKFSFLTLWAGATVGFANVRTEANARWSFAADAVVRLHSRLSRSRNFSVELSLDAGLAYLGELPYIEKRVSVFGDGPERTRLRPLLGPFVGFSLRFVGWNDVF